MGDEGEDDGKVGSRVPEWMAQPCVKTGNSATGQGSDQEFMTDMMLSLQVNMSAGKVSRVPALTHSQSQLLSAC